MITIVLKFFCVLVIFVYIFGGILGNCFNTFRNQAKSTTQ